MVTAAEVEALAIFGATIVLVAVFDRWRAPLAVAGAAATVAVGIVPPGSLLPHGWSATGSVIDWNALVVLAGLLLYAALLGALGIPRYVALRLAGRLKERPAALVATVAALTFLLAMFLNSIAVVLVLVPVALEISLELGLPAVPFVLAVLMSANLGGAATPIGNPPNLILATSFALPFTGFLAAASLPAIAAFAATLAFLLRRFPRRPVTPGAPVSAPPVLERVPVAGALAGFAAVVALLATESSVGLPLWPIGLGAGALAVALAGAARRRTLLADLDVSTIVFLLALFVVVGGLEASGTIAAAAGLVERTRITDPHQLGLLLLAGLGGISAFIDNIPLAAVAAPLLASLGSATGTPPARLAYPVVVGLGVGGNGTPIGSIGNVTGLSLADRAGVRIGWGTYLRFGLIALGIGFAAAGAVWLVVG
ncbi:MAG: SLC13 family permease [Thermoplasmata archaeon]